MPLEVSTKTISHLGRLCDKEAVSLSRFCSELPMSWLQGGGGKKGCLARNLKVIESRKLNLNQNIEVRVVGFFFLFAEIFTKSFIAAALSSLKCIKCVVFMVSSCSD